MLHINLYKMEETIFYLEGRGGMFLYHFFIYNLGGLYYILNGIYNLRGPTKTSILFDDVNKLIDLPTNVSTPIKIHMKNLLPFQREAFDIIKDKFTLIEDLSDIQNYKIVSIYGETVINNYYSDNPNVIFNFLRNLFLEKMNYDVVPKKRIFITRKNSEAQHGRLKRAVLNENEFLETLKKYNFQLIQLENYNTHDKIKLFMESELIVSSNSSCLTLSLFANKKSNIIEILKNGDSGFPHEHYYNICKILGLNYNRYSNINEDDDGNFNIDVNDFEMFLRKFIA